MIAPANSPAFSDRPHVDIVLAVVPFSHQARGGVHQVSARILTGQVREVTGALDWRLSANAERAAGRDVDPVLWRMWENMIAEGDQEAMAVTSLDNVVDAEWLADMLLEMMAACHQGSRVWVAAPSCCLPQLRGLMGDERKPWPFRADQTHDLHAFADIWMRDSEFPASGLFAYHNADAQAAWLARSLNGLQKAQGAVHG